ncbi:hypothetical protein [uncultured Shewanella sp.]|uniref:hypothetical protein n=1 Tax=uncultured Shewanella sp. TaxID=173975 RepID=UPI002630E23B|nr:hypothetical protein [uncultured Shewanella sp.]
MEILLIILIILLSTCSITLGFYYSQNKPALWLVTFAITACAVLTGIVSAFFPDIHWLTHFTYTFIPLICLYHCRYYPNWLYLLSIPIGINFIDVLWINQNLFAQTSNWIFYTKNIGLGSLVLLLIFYRGSIAKTLGLSIHYRRIPQEYLLLSIYTMNVIINIMTLMEDLIRNNHILGELFVPYQPMFLYDIYHFIRFPLNLGELILYVVIAYFAVRSNKVDSVAHANM